MNHSILSVPSRRQFMAGIVPACALTFLGSGSAWAKNPFQDDPKGEEAKHKFDQAFDRELSYSTFFRIRYGEFMELAAALQKEWGQEKLIEFLKKNTTERLLQYGQAQAKQMGKSDFQSYVNPFRSTQYEKSLTKEIVEDTETVFELKVTECIWAKTFLDAKLGEIGNAHVCHGDYAWARGFNPKIKMERTKTLTQGHDCCNHRYLWIG